MIINPRQFTSLFYNKHIRNYPAKILHITDTEGDVNSFLKSIEKSSIVTFNRDNGLQFTRDINSKEKP
jgi:hypothetical protein